MNRLIYGDNMLAMAALLAGDDEDESFRGQFGLIYTDPPFDSKADYRTRVELPGATVEQRPAVIEQYAYSDTWADGTASFLAMLTPRLVLMRELLAPTGSIVVHLDWHVGHYVKLVLDEVFGKQNFRNEIVWTYKRWTTKSEHLPRLHDTLFWYSKGAEYQFTQPMVANDKPNPSQYVSAKDEAGKTVVLRDESGAAVKREVREEIPVADYWDIPQMSPVSKERVNYPTQKPLRLAARVIEMCTREGDLVGDFFAGSGTTAAAAEAAGRRWVVSDLGKPAIMVTRKRLIDRDADPFLYQAIGDYQIEQARSTLGRRFRIGDLAQVVLRLFGAMPLPREDNPSGTLGRLPGSKTLVFADSPSRMTTVSTLQRAQQLRDSVLGGFDRVIVLGWNFTASIGQDIQALADSALEVLAIPPDLLDRLRKKGTKLDKLADEVRFSSLQYLEIDTPIRTATGDGEELQVVLRNYVLLSPDALSLDEKNRAALREVMNAEPLALIEYWAVDPDYDGEVFRSVWQDYRGNVDNDGDPLRVVARALLPLSARSGSRRVCVRAVDVFGFESEVVVDAVELAQ